MTAEEAWRAGVQDAMRVAAQHFTALKYDGRMSKQTAAALVELQRKFSDLYSSHDIGER